MGLSSQFIGQKVKVTAADGSDLFTLNSGVTEVSVTAKDLYAKKIQWFEPEADNYIPLNSIDPHFGTSAKVKHFTWKQVADFSMVDRWMTSYRSGGSGDWKGVKEGADGYLMVDVGGKPFWADGVGQIPFAVDSFKHLLSEGSSEEEAIKGTLVSAQQHSTGNIIPTAPVVSNEYDDYFVLRGAIWASRRYDSEKRMRPGKFNPRTGDTIDVPYYAVIDGTINPSPDELGNSLPASVPRKYGLIP